MPAIILLSYYYGMLLFNITEASKLQIIGAPGVKACPGSILTLECIVNGEPGDSTVGREQLWVIVKLYCCTIGSEDQLALLGFAMIVP